MALGAVTLPQINPAGGGNVVQGPLRLVVLNVVGDSSYVTGGSVLAPATFGLNQVLVAQAEIQASSGANCSAGSAAYNTATGKLQCFANTGIEVAGAVNLSGITWQIIAWGY